MNIYENDQNNSVVNADFTVSADDFSVSAGTQDLSEDITVLTASSNENEDASVFTYEFRKPIAYENRSITKLSFDWETLTGRDALNIENELQALGKMVLEPAFSGDYIVRMAARASEPSVDLDFFNYVSLRDLNKIRSAARTFLLKSES